MAGPQLTQWHSRFGGIEWRVTTEGVETRPDGLMRTPGEPITIRRLLSSWGPRLKSVALITKVPLEILMMTVATEGALRWRGDHFSYPPLRKEPGYTSDGETPHRISFGPMHVLLSTYRAAMRDPHAGRMDAMSLPSNLLAGALYIADQAAVHGFDPILVAACYNAGGLYRAGPGSRYHNRWHLRTYGSHLDRAARWYGDACAVVQDKDRPSWPAPDIDPDPLPPTPILERQ